MLFCYSKNRSFVFFSKKPKDQCKKTTNQPTPKDNPFSPQNNKYARRLSQYHQYFKDTIHSPNSWLSVDLCLPNPFICSTRTTSQGKNDGYILLWWPQSTPARGSRRWQRCPSLAVTELLPELGVIKPVPGSAAPRLINIAPVTHAQCCQLTLLNVPLKI